MALFPVNQNCQFFTPTSAEVTELKKAANNTDGTVASGSNLLIKDADKMWFTATSGAGQHRSEVVEIKNGGYIKYVAADDMIHVAKCIKLTINSAVNNGTPVNGEVYGLYINQRSYQAIGERNYMELGAEVRIGSDFDLGDTTSTTITSAADLLNALALGFVRNLGIDDNLYRVVVATASNAAATEVSATTDLHNTSTVAIYIMEKEQDWIQGTMQREELQLSTQDVFLSTITVDTIEKDNWGTVSDETLDTNNEGTSGTIEYALNASSIKYTWTNAKDIADMEWFYLGEHGDQQRLMGYPYVNAATLRGTIYNIDPNDTINGNANPGYDLITIHHAYVGNGTFVQKSEKDIMIAVPSTTDSYTDYKTGVELTASQKVKYQGKYYTITSAKTAAQNTAWDATNATEVSTIDGVTIAAQMAIALGAIASGTCASTAVYPF